MQDILFGRCEKWLVNIYKKTYGRTEKKWK